MSPPLIATLLIGKVYKKTVDDAVRKGCERALKKCAKLTQKEARRLVSLQASWVGPRGGVHYIPSPPGMPPHMRTGTLRRSIEVGIVTKKLTVQLRLAAEGWYGKIHEFGGRLIPPRPFFRPALANTLSKFPEEFANLLTKANDPEDNSK